MRIHQTQPSAISERRLLYLFHPADLCKSGELPVHLEDAHDRARIGIYPPIGANKFMNVLKLQQFSIQAV